MKTPPIFNLIKQSAYRYEDVGYEDVGTKGRCMLLMKHINLECDTREN